jgi:hypothetical protein
MTIFRFGGMRAMSVFTAYSLISHIADLSLAPAVMC